MNNIEKLKTEVDEIKNSLNTLKDNVTISKVEKKNQAEALKKQADTTKQKIEDTIKILKDKSDEASKKKKEEAETLLKSFSEITNLYSSIINSEDNKPSMENESEINQKGGKKQSKKSFRSKWYWKFIWRSIAWLWTYFLGKWLHLWWKNNNEKQNDNNIQLKNELQDKIAQKQKNESQKKWNNTNNNTKEFKETLETWPDKISNEMFEELLKMEGKQKKGDALVAWIGTQFWEKSATWPFGMAYKHIDEQGNLLKKIIHFKSGEKVTEDWARKNARAYYDKKAKEWKDLLDSKWCKYNQNILDSLVCQSWWTKKSTNSLKEYVISHRNDKDGIFNFISKHAITAAWNWKVMPGLVKRAKFAANRFIWNKKPFHEYKA